MVIFTAEADSLSISLSPPLQMEHVGSRLQGEAVLVAVLKQIVVLRQAELELSDEVGEHQVDEGETEVFADAFPLSSLNRGSYTSVGVQAS